MSTSILSAACVAPSLAFTPFERVFCRARVCEVLRYFDDWLSRPYFYGSSATLTWTHGTHTVMRSQYNYQVLHI